MIVEKFDFKRFFDFKNRHIVFRTSIDNEKYTRFSGVGAVSIITPSQAVTRWTSIKRDIRGVLQLGGGHHISTAIVLERRLIHYFI